MAVSLLRASRTMVAGTTFSQTGDSALVLTDADENTVDGNTFSSTGDATVVLHNADGNTVTGNNAAHTSDAAFVLEAGSNDNLVAANVVEGTTNDDGIRIMDSGNNHILENVAHGAGDSGISLTRAHGNLIRGNDVRHNVSGLELTDAHGNRLEANDASHSGGIAIEVQNSLRNVLVANNASHSGGRGIEVTGAAEADDGNLLERNTASANGSGIVVTAAGHTLTENVASHNNGWGIQVAPGTVDGGRNRAFGNTQQAQCHGIHCILQERDPAQCDDVTLSAEADTWVDQNSAQTNKGTDSVLKVRSQGPSGNFRALVRFPLPAPPAGCRLQSATLRLYAAASTEGRSLDVRRVTGQWSEAGVTWTTQPATTGDPAVATSGLGWREWTVTAQVTQMLAGSNHGFLVRDVIEGQTGEQQFHSREKGSLTPELVIQYRSD